MNKPTLPFILRDPDIDDQPPPDVGGGGAGIPSMPDRVFERLPAVMRIQSLARTLAGDAIHNRATLYHRKATLCVDWITAQVDTRLHRHGLVAIQRAATTRCHDGAIRIQRLRPVSRALPSFNLFDTLLPEWLKDRDLAVRAQALWEDLPRPLGHLVNAVLWDETRLHRFVTGPSSLHGHPHDIGGNFRHSIEVAERARGLGRCSATARMPLLIAGGLLHDVAKAAEYRYDREDRQFKLSDRGELVGHRQTLLEWLATARVSAGVIIAEGTWLGLLHMLCAVRGAPAGWGLREPQSLEAELLAMADRLCGHEDAYPRYASPDGAGGRGVCHSYAGHRTDITAEA